MSKLFGPFIQQGYVVPDAQAAMAHWIARGVGPFFVEAHIRPPGEYDGEAIQADLTAAFAYSGDQQIEVIEQHCDTPTVYRDFLETHPQGGLHHLAAWVDEIPAKLEVLAAGGHDYRVRQRYGDMHAYLDRPDEVGVMIQLMARVELMTGMFDAIRAAADAWDGTTQPIRSIDWSSGFPVIE